MKDSRNNFRNWENQARQFFGDDFWDDILNVMPNQAAGSAGETDTTDQADGHGRKQPRSSVHVSQPAIDIYKSEKQIIVHVELPGLANISAVDVYMQNGNLVVSGHLSRRFTREQTVQSERFTGDFKRVIALPERIDEDGIQARYTNGLLEITFPRLRKRKESPPMRIPIKQDPYER
ncbi:MAG: Hsp20/alpha crystallin family protein [Tumebacillaceae bacterium]